MGKEIILPDSNNLVRVVRNLWQFGTFVRGLTLKAWSKVTAGPMEPEHSDGSPAWKWPEVEGTGDSSEGK